MTKTDLLSGIFISILIIIFGFLIMFSKDSVWSVFQIFYGQLEIEAEPSRFWPMLVDTIGLTFIAAGLLVSVRTWRRWRDQA